MKPLAEYPTPLTDKMDSLRYKSDDLFALARDLERKLALCRDALDEMESIAETNSASMCEEDQITMNCIIEIAAEALEATK